MADALVSMRTRLLEPALMERGLSYRQVSPSTFSYEKFADSYPNIAKLHLRRYPEYQIWEATILLTFVVDVSGARAGLVTMNKHGMWRAYRLHAGLDLIDTALSKNTEHRARIDAVLELPSVMALYDSIGGGA